MIVNSNKDNNNESKKAMKDFTYNSINPYVPAVVEHITEKRYRKASGLKWEEVLNPNTGELEKKSYLVLGEQKKLDKQEYYKMYHGSIKSFYNLSNKTMDLFEFIMKNIRYGNDRICIVQTDVLTMTKMSPATYFRCILQLLNAQIIAKADTEGCYYINPSIAFKGDRITLVKQYIMDSSEPGKLGEDDIPYGDSN